MIAFACVSLLWSPGVASAQIVEAVGSRALGMGGAFVAVASDSSATWWNPGALAAGPFLDMALGRAVTERADALPAGRDRVHWLALGTPPFGLSYYRLRSTGIGPGAPTAPGGANREGRGAEVPARLWSVSQVGATLVRTLLPGVHGGTTLKYVRGRFGSGRVESGKAPSDLLDLGENIEGAPAEHAFDLDVGVLATAGPIRVGGVVRNVRQPSFGGGAFRVPRQARVGAAVDVEEAGGPPLTVAFDADVRTYQASGGDRRVLAAGAEHWLFGRRLGIRAGARVNRVGARERAFTGGTSVALRSGFYVDAHVVRGGSPEERGWGAATRVSF